MIPNCMPSLYFSRCIEGTPINGFRGSEGIMVIQEGVREALPQNHITWNLHKIEWAALLQAPPVPPVCGAESKLHCVLVH